jgi:hypothetical protein
MALRNDQCGVNDATESPGKTGLVITHQSSGSSARREEEREDAMRYGSRQLLLHKQNVGAMN